MGSGLLESDLLEEDLSDLTVLTCQIISSCCDNNTYQQTDVAFRVLAGLGWSRRSTATLDWSRLVSALGWSRLSFREVFGEPSVSFS